YVDSGAPLIHGDLVEFMTRIALASLIDRLDPKERELLRLLTVFTTHVPVSVAACLGSIARLATDHEDIEAIERLITLGLVDVTLPSSSRPGMTSPSDSDNCEVAVNPLVAPAALAATRALLDEDITQVAQITLRPLRIAWNTAVQSRDLRACRELTRLAQHAND